jgi:hypothetical protein
VDLKNIKEDPPGKSEVSQGENREPGGSSFFWIKNSKLLATFDNYRLCSKNSKYDLVIATSRFFQKFRRIAVSIYFQVRIVK